MRYFNDIVISGLIEDNNFRGRHSYHGCLPWCLLYQGKLSKRISSCQLRKRYLNTTKPKSAYHVDQASDLIFPELHYGDLARVYNVERLAVLPLLDYGLPLLIPLHLELLTQLLQLGGALELLQELIVFEYRLNHGDLLIRAVLRLAVENR